jgi:hypothetical protein
MHPLCSIHAHKFVKAHLPVIDDWGEIDSIRCVLCLNCGHPLQKKWNLLAYNQGIDDLGSAACAEIQRIGIEQYRLNRIEEGKEIWANA